MSRALPFTQAHVCRLIAAAQKAGLRVTGLRPDGTVLVNEAGVDAPFTLTPDNAETSKWEDVEA